jgi:hypothetical protein
LPFLETSLACNRPDTSVRFLELSHRGFTVPVDGDVLVIHENALSIVVAGEAKDVPELSLLFGLVRLLLRCIACFASILLVGDEAKRVVCNHTVLHGVRKAVLKN